MNLLRRLFALLHTSRHPDELSKSNASTSEEQALLLALRTVAAKGLAWREPVQAEYRTSADGNYWVIQTNCTGRDHRIFIAIDDATGKVVRVQSHGRVGAIDHGI